MDNQNVKHRTRDTDNNVTPDTTATPTTNKSSRNNMKAGGGGGSRRDRRMAMAKRGIRSLAIAVSIPLSLTVFNIYFFGSTSNGYGTTTTRPFWFPPLWILHATCLASTFFMSLSAWLVWAEGWFHRKPVALSLYLAQLGLSLAWDPIVFRMGATWVGLVVCLAMFGALVGCSRHFKEVNPIAADLVKPCLAWAAFLAIVNLKLAFL